MQYDTHNIDEAAYLSLQGYRFSVTRTGPISAAFSFLTDSQFDNVRAKFWKGEATVQLHQWLATRAALKNECAGQALRQIKQLSSPSIIPAASPTIGVAYWFRDGAAVKSEPFGNRPLHRMRLAEGNFYLTREDAQLRRNPVQPADAAKEQIQPVFAESCRRKTPT
jgi:hypothetical protein